MALEMRPSCEECTTALAPDGESCICAYERTFCPGYSAATKAISLNGGG